MIFLPWDPQMCQMRNPVYSYRPTLHNCNTRLFFVTVLWNHVEDTYENYFSLQL